jgi:hypothetical protein
MIADRFAGSNANHEAHSMADAANNLAFFWFFAMPMAAWVIVALALASED